jgi:hypothetical protein
MAVLLLKNVFQRTWGPHLKGEPCEREFWPYAIDLLRSTGSDCLLLAEAYWGKQKELLNHGFDYAYDKTLYDLMVGGEIQGLRDHLSVTAAAQERMIRFLENHDEPRALAAFGFDRIKSAMIIHATLPGMRFWHHGQFEGTRIRVPVQLGRAPLEPLDNDLKSFSEALLREVNHPVFHEGDWEMCSTYGWQDNPSHINLLAWCWRRAEERRLVVTNFSSSPAQGYVKLPPGWLPEREEFLCRDPLKQECFRRPSAEASRSGLYVGLGIGDFHFFRIEQE